MADTSLWPIVASGLLTGLFALGGIAVGLVGASRRDVTQQRHEKAKRRAEKFEEKFDKLISEMEVASLVYLNSILSKNFNEEYTYLNDREQGRIAAEYWMDLGAKRTALTNALKAFAHDEFQ
jgi:hypothetical protein